MIVKKFKEELKRGMLVYQDSKLDFGYIVSLDDNCNKNATSISNGQIINEGGQIHIVFMNGTESFISELFLREGIQCGVCVKQPDVNPTDEYIQERLERVKILKQREKNKKELEENQFEIECNELKSSKAHLHLTPFVNKYQKPTDVAKNVRKELKHHFKSCKFKVKTSGVNLHVDWIDGPTKKQVDNVLGKFSGVTENFKEDLRTFKLSPFMAVFGGVNNVITSRSHSDRAIEEGINYVLTEYDCRGLIVDLKSYKNGSLFKVRPKRTSESVTSLIQSYMMNKPC